MSSYPLSGREAVDTLSQIANDVRHFSGQDVAMVDLPWYLQICLSHTDWSAVSEHERAALALKRMEGPRGR